MGLEQLPEDFSGLEFLGPEVCQLVDICVDVGLALSDFFVFFTSPQGGELNLMVGDVLLLDPEVHEDAGEVSKDVLRIDDYFHYIFCEFQA